jgi:hypothetical protein
MPVSLRLRRPYCSRLADDGAGELVSVEMHRRRNTIAGRR